MLSGRSASLLVACCRPVTISRPFSTTLSRHGVPAPKDPQAVGKPRRQNWLPAVYYRGGTSRAIFFRAENLPPDQSKWNDIFLGCIGSPDEHGRQLDGLGGGISSLSKVCVVGKSTQSGADVDYTFVSLGIKNTHVDLSSNCGNMSAAVGPFAIDAGIVKVPEGIDEATVRIFNTNTEKIIESSFAVADGEAAAYGDFSIDGVSGTAAKVELKFLKPAGSRTGKLFPTGSKAEDIDGVRVTCIDSGNPCCFVPAKDLHIKGTLTPEEIEDHPTLGARLESIRRKAGVRMGLAAEESEVPGSVPKIAIVSKPENSTNSVVIRAMSVGQPHKAIPVTVALAAATAANFHETTVSGCIKQDSSRSGITIYHAGGTLDVAAEFDSEGAVESAKVFRTARRLMEGRVFWK